MSALGFQLQPSNNNNSNSNASSLTVVQFASTEIADANLIGQILELNCTTQQTQSNNNSNISNSSSTNINLICLAACTHAASCTSTTIICNAAHCQLLCNGSYACSHMTLIGNGNADMQVVDVICHGNHACNYLDLQVTNALRLNVHCLQSQSCVDAQITIANDTSSQMASTSTSIASVIATNSSIHCYQRNACTNLVITTDYGWSTRLTMYERSDNIIIRINYNQNNNNYYYQPSSSLVDCNPNHAYYYYYYEYNAFLAALSLFNTSSASSLNQSNHSNATAADAVDVVLWTAFSSLFAGALCNSIPVFVQ